MKTLYHTMNLKSPLIYPTIIVRSLGLDGIDALCSDLLFASHDSSSSFTYLVMYEREVSLHEILVCYIFQTFL